MRVGVGVVNTGRIRALDEPHLDLAEPHPGAFIERPIRHNAIRYAGGYRNSGLLDRGARRAAAVMDLGEELQIPDARGTRYGYLGVGVHGEGHHAVDIGGRQTRVIECGQHGLSGKAQFTAARVLGEVSGTDSRDRGLAGKLAGHQAPPIVRVAVAIT